MNLQLKDKWTRNTYQFENESKHNRTIPKLADSKTILNKKGQAFNKDTQDTCKTTNLLSTKLSKKHGYQIKDI